MEEEINSQDFIALLTDTSIISDKVISDNLNIVEKRLPQSGVVVKNCTFRKPVIFSESNLNSGIKFIDCVFEDSLTFADCIAKNYDHEFNFESGDHIRISNTKINGLYFRNANDIERGVTICNKSIIKRLQVDSLNCDKGSFAVNESTIEGLFDILIGSFANSVEVRAGSLIKAKVRFANISTQSITFTDSVFERDLHFYSNTISSLIFNDGVFKDDFNITGTKMSDSLTIIGTEFKKSFILKINDETNDKIGALNSIFIESAKFNEPIILNVDNTEIKSFNVRFSKPLEGAIYLNYCNLSKVNISGDNYSGNIVFNHCNFNELVLDTFYNYSTFSIISAKAYGENSLVRITNSNLGKAHFFNTFFDSFSKIIIYSSVFTEIVTANVKWFEPHNLNPTLNKESHEFAQKKEIYRQLKYALEKQGDRIGSLRFKSLEMRAFKEESFSDKKWYNKIFDTDRFILWVGQSNDFGLNWPKPVLLLLGFSLIFYGLIIVGVSEKLSYGINTSSESINQTFNELKNYLYIWPQLLNPVHSLDRIFKSPVKIGLTVHFIDYLLKVFLAFFIFQIISAFRKFIK